MPGFRLEDQNLRSAILGPREGLQRDHGFDRIIRPPSQNGVEECGHRLENTGTRHREHLCEPHDGADALSN